MNQLIDGIKRVVGEMQKNQLIEALSSKKKIYLYIK
jgi:hypothetical protein